MIVVREQDDRTIYDIVHEASALKLARGLKRKFASPVRTAGAAWDLYIEGEREAGNVDKDIEHKQDSFNLLLDRDLPLDELGDTTRCQARYDSARRRAKPRTLIRCAQAAAKRGVKAWPKHDVGAIEGCLCKRYAVDTHKNALGEVKTFIRFCVAPPRKWLRSSGFEAVKGVGKRKKGEDAKEQLTVDEAKRLIITCQRGADRGDQSAVAVLMTVTMGMRRKEICTRVVRSVDMNGTRLWVKGKGGKTRYLKIPLLLRPYVQQLREGKEPTASLWNKSRSGRAGRPAALIMEALRAAAPACLTPEQLAARLTPEVTLAAIYVHASRLARNGTIGRGDKKGQYRHLDITPTPMAMRRRAARTDAPLGNWVLDAVKRYCLEAGVPVVTAHANRGLHKTLQTIGGLDKLLDEIAAEAGHTDKRTTIDHYIKGQALSDAGQDAVLAALGLEDDDPNQALPSGNDSPGIIPGASSRGGH